jgi:hypothetical protein
MSWSEMTEQVNALKGIPFRRYAIEFIEMIGTFTRIRAPWLALLPADDAMHFDEIALRTLESKVLQEFLKEQYPLGYWQGAHSLEARIKSVPVLGAAGTPARLDRFIEERRTAICRTVENMKKGYELARAAMGDVPTSETLTSFDRMLRLLQDAQNASREGHLNTVRGLTIREMGVGLLGSGSRSNKMKSSPFDGQHGHIVEFHIRRAAEQGPGGGSWVHGAVTASDEDMMDTVTGSLVDQADPSYSGLPCLEAKEILGLIQPWLVGSKMQDEVICDLSFSLWQDMQDVDLHYGGASFEVEFSSSYDAHLAAMLAQYYYITDGEGNRYSIEAHRMRHKDREILGQPHMETFGGASNRSQLLKLDNAAYKVPQRRGRGEFRNIHEESSASSGPPGGPHDAPRLVNHPVSQSDAPPEPGADQAGWLEPSDSENDEDLRICSQCTLAVDPQHRISTTIEKGWKYSEKTGKFGILQYDKLFCNNACLNAFRNGREPTPPTQQMKDLQHKQDQQAIADLLMHQAYKLQATMPGGPKDWEGSLPEGHHLPANALRMLRSTMANLMCDAKGGRAVSQPSAKFRDFAALQREARNLRMTTQKEHQAEIDKIDVKDPNRDYKILRIELSAQRRPLLRQDRLNGVPRNEAYKAHQHRVRQAIKEAIKLGAVDAMEKEEVTADKAAALEAAEEARKSRKKETDVAERKRARKVMMQRSQKLKLWMRLCAYLASRDDGTSVAIQEAYAWYLGAEARQFENWAEDEERVRLEEYFTTAIVGWELPPGAAYHLQNCFHHRYAPKIAGGILPIHFLQRQGQTRGPCLLNLSHQGPCRDVLPPDAPGASFSLLDTPVDESAGDLQLAAARQKDSEDPVLVTDALAEVQLPLNRGAKCKRTEETFSNLRELYKKHMGADSSIHYETTQCDNRPHLMTSRNANTEYRKAKAILACFLPPPVAEKVEKPIPGIHYWKDGNSPDGEEKGGGKGNSKRRKQEPKKSLKRPDRTGNSSWSGAYTGGYGKRRCTTSPNSGGFTSAGTIRTLSILALLPTLGSCTHLMTIVPIATTLGAGSALMTWAVYAAGLTTTFSIMKSVPELVQHAQVGLEDIVTEAVEETKGVIRGISTCIYTIAVTVIMITCYLMYAHSPISIETWWRRQKRIADKNSFFRDPDHWIATHGGRLKGGAPRSFVSAEQSTQGIGSANRIPRGGGPPGGPEEAYSGQVDPDLLRYDQAFAFNYDRGNRVGERRIVNFRRLIHTGQGARMEVSEAGLFQPKIKHYWIEGTYDADYAPVEGVTDHRPIRYHEPANRYASPGLVALKDEQICSALSVANRYASQEQTESVTQPGSTAGSISPDGGLGLNSSNESQPRPRRTLSDVRQDLTLANIPIRNQLLGSPVGRERRLSTGSNSRKRASSADSSIFDVHGTRIKEASGWRGPFYAHLREGPRGQDRRPSAPELSGSKGRLEATTNLRDSARSQNERTSKRNSFFYTGADMLPAILKEVTRAERTIDGWAYQIDHRDIIAATCLRVARYGVVCRLIFDKENFYSSTCARQATGVNELYKAGCLIRVRKPSGGLYACVHVKCLIFDGKVTMSGSLNLTHNGLQNNKEHLYLLSEPEFIQEMTADFEKDWTLAEAVGEREISIMIAKDKARKDERQASAAQTIPIRQNTAEPGTTLKNCMMNPDWRNHLDLDIKDGCPVAFRMRTPDGGPVAFRPRQVDTVGPARQVPSQQTEPQESPLVHFPKPAYVSVGASRSKDVSRFDGTSKVPSTVWSDRGQEGRMVSEKERDAKEKCEKLMIKQIADERKEGGGRPSARGQGTVESYVSAGQQRESTYETDFTATGGLLSTCRVPPKRFLAESGSSNHP